MTIDIISHGRFGVNIVTGWQKAEYDQMGLWPGEEHFTHRYEVLEEYATVCGSCGDRPVGPQGQVLHDEGLPAGPAAARRRSR